MNTELTETQAIEIAKEKLLELDGDFTMSLMNKQEADDYIWGYLYDMQLQYLPPIEYRHNNGHQAVVLIHE